MLEATVGAPIVADIMVVFSVLGMVVVSMVVVGFEVVFLAVVVVVIVLVAGAVVVVPTHVTLGGGIVLPIDSSIHFIPYSERPYSERLLYPGGPRRWRAWRRRSGRGPCFCTA